MVTLSGRPMILT